MPEHKEKWSTKHDFSLNVRLASLVNNTLKEMDSVFKDNYGTVLYNSNLKILRHKYLLDIAIKRCQTVGNLGYIIF